MSPLLTLEADRAEALDLAARIVHLGGRLGVLHHELVHCAADYDASGMWAFSGRSTCAGWLAETLAVSLGTAREWLRVGHALHQLPQTDAAFAEGRLSYRQVRTLTRIAVDHPDRDAELVELAVRTPARHLALALATWTSQHEDAEELERRHRRDTSLSARVEPDGMGLITLRLPAIEHGRIMAAIDSTVMRSPATHRTETASTDARSPQNVTRPSLDQQRAAAFVDLVTHGGTRVTTEVIVHVRADGNTLHDGTPLSDHAVARLLPKSFLRAMIHDAQSHPIDVSGRHRHPTDRQQLVVRERQPACPCGATAFLQTHHEPPFEQSRRTVIDELETKCSRCHRLRHRGG